MDVARNAAPGVDQTTDTGIFSRQLRIIESSPYPNSETAMAVLACSALAFIAARPARAIPNVATLPVVEATVPAKNGAICCDFNYADLLFAAVERIGITLGNFLERISSAVI